MTLRMIYVGYVISAQVQGNFHDLCIFPLSRDIRTSEPTILPRLSRLQHPQQDMSNISNQQSSVKVSNVTIFLRFLSKTF